MKVKVEVEQAKIEAERQAMKEKIEAEEGKGAAEKWRLQVEKECLLVKKTKSKSDAILVDERLKAEKANQLAISKTDRTDKKRKDNIILTSEEERRKRGRLTGKKASG